MGDKNTNIGLIITVLISTLVVLFEKSYGTVNDCKFPAIFNFGDSNSDTGSGGIKFEPCGMTWMSEDGQRDRACDGRLIIDFIAEKLGLPYLRGYPIKGANYSTGVNFAVFGSTIRSFIPAVAMDQRQMDWFIEFRNQTLELYASKGEQPDRPKPEDFSKALYTIDIGQNGIAGLSKDNMDFVIGPDLLRLYSFIQRLYNLGGRRFWILHNTGPLGCLFPGNGPKDEVGCNNDLNEICKEFNNQLTQMLQQLRNKFKDASFVYVDVYTAKYTLFKDAPKLGFKDPFVVAASKCADKKAESCRPKEYINWDGHYTEAANKMVADRIMDGSMSDPPLPITGACPSTDPPKIEL